MRADDQGEGCRDGDYGSHGWVELGWLEVLVRANVGGILEVGGRSGEISRGGGLDVGWRRERDTRERILLIVLNLLPPV